MANFDWSRPILGDVYIEGAVEAPKQRTEPLLTAEQLIIRYLFGVPLVSQIPDPITKKRAVLTDSIVNDLINQAALKVEAELGIVLFETEIVSREPFDRATYNSFGFMRLANRPMNRLLSLNIESSDGQLLMQVPPQWIDPGNFVSGQINIVPIALSTFPNGQLAGSPTQGGGSLYISILQGASWVADFWTVRGVFGWPKSSFPVWINDLIGTQAAIDILGMLGATYARTQGASLSLDAMSQSYSGPGSRIYELRIGQLEAQKKRLFERARMYMGLKFNSSNV